MKKVCVIGGGPAGVMSAYAASLGGADVTIIERNTEILKKLMLTGNGKCNYSNADLSVESYSFDASHPFSNVIKEYDSTWLENLFLQNGMYTYIKDSLKYPRSEKAETVRDTLLDMLKKQEVSVITDKKVTSIKSSIDSDSVKVDNNNACSRFTVSFEDGGEIKCDALIISTGGKAYPSTGSDGAGYRLAREAGHNVTFTYPVLTRLFTEDKDVLNLAGVRYKGRVSAYLDGKEVGEEEGEIQFTDKGLSGICVFNISRYLSKPIEEGASCFISVDFLPEKSDCELAEYLRKRLDLAGKDEIKVDELEDILSKMISPKIAGLIVEKLCGKNSEKVEISDDTVTKLVNLITDFKIKISAHDSFSAAQVTKGGVDISEVSEMMESKLCKNLYFAGEVLDVDAKCGGYNLHWAFASGMKAGESAAK